MTTNEKILKEVLSDIIYTLIRSGVNVPTKAISRLAQMETIKKECADVSCPACYPA